MIGGLPRCDVLLCSTALRALLRGEEIKPKVTRHFFLVNFSYYSSLRSGIMENRAAFKAFYRQFRRLRYRTIVEKSFEDMNDMNE